METELYTKAEKDKFFEKVMDYLSLKMREIQRSKTLTFKEMGQLTNLQPNRICDLVSKRYINEKILHQIIQGGVVLEKEIIQNVNLTKKDLNYLQSISKMSAKTIRLLVKVQNIGGDADKILSEWLKKNR